MYADGMTKRGGNIPLLQTLMKTGRVCITEESATLERHRTDSKPRSSSSKTWTDPAECEGLRVSGSTPRFSSSPHAAVSTPRSKVCKRQ